MNKQEWATLKADLIEEIRAAELQSRGNGLASKALQPIYDKWCNGENKHGIHGDFGPLIEAIPGYKGWQTWEYIRKLTCNIMRASYVREIKDVDKARKIADKLCEVVVELAKEV